MPLGTKTFWKLVYFHRSYPTSFKIFSQYFCESKIGSAAQAVGIKIFIKNDALKSNTKPQPYNRNKYLRFHLCQGIHFL